MIMLQCSVVVVMVFGGNSWSLGGEKNEGVGRGEEGMVGRTWGERLVLPINSFQVKTHTASDDCSHEVTSSRGTVIWGYTPVLL